MTPRTATSHATAATVVSPTAYPPELLELARINAASRVRRIRAAMNAQVPVQAPDGQRGYVVGMGATDRGESTALVAYKGYPVRYYTETLRTAEEVVTEGAAQ